MRCVVAFAEVGVGGSNGVAAAEGAGGAACNGYAFGDCRTLGLQKRKISTAADHAALAVGYGAVACEA
jgi:hypothetical protein